MLVQLFINLKLRLKLLLAFGSLLGLTISLVIIFFHTLNRIELYEKASEEIDAASIDVLEMDAGVKYFTFEGYKSDAFQTRHESPHLQSYFDHLMAVRSRLEIIKSLRIAEKDSLIVIIQNMIVQTDARINYLKELFQVRGFKDYGLEGKLREAIHTVEKSSYPYNKADMLTLRRHEKDFFLRKDLKYQKEFDSKIINFVSAIQNSPSSEEKIIILENLENYQKQFTKIVNIEEQIGLKESDGVKGAINQNLDHLKKSISLLRSMIKIKSKDFKNSAIISLIILFGTQIILGVLLAIAYSNLITKAIKELQRAMSKLAEGHFPAPLTVKSNEEIGKTKFAFNQLLDRMKAATNFAESIGDGKLKTQYTSQFTDDILAQAMIRMQSQLVILNEKQAIAHWVDSGIAKLNDLIKNEGNDLNTLGDQLLRHIVNYLKANQGALYIMQGTSQEQYLERIATFAYNKKKFIEQRVEIGQGQIGQCVLEKAPLILKDIPSDYIKITSGLGEAVPHFIIIQPLLIHEKVMGVLELASFQEFKSHEINFLERISETIGSILANRRTLEETKNVIIQGKDTEEMKGIKEQLFRKNISLENEVHKLKSELKLLARKTVVGA